MLSASERGACALETDLRFPLISWDIPPFSFLLRDPGLDVEDDREQSVALTWQEMHPSSSSLGIHFVRASTQARQGGNG